MVRTFSERCQVWHKWIRGQPLTAGLSPCSGDEDSSPQQEYSDDSADMSVDEDDSEDS